MYLHALQKLNIPSYRYNFLNSFNSTSVSNEKQSITFTLIYMYLHCSPVVVYSISDQEVTELQI